VGEIIWNDDDEVVGDVSILGRRRVQDNQQLRLGHHAVVGRRVELRRRWKHNKCTNDIVEVPCQRRHLIPTGCPASLPPKKREN